MDIRTGRTAGSLSTRGAQHRQPRPNAVPEVTVQPLGVPLWTRC